MILGIQILGIIFGLLMAYFCFLHYKRKEFSKLQFASWELLWLGFIFVVLFPRITDSLLQELSIPRAMDLIIILGFIFVVFLTFYNYVAINKLRKGLENKIREEALRDLNNKI